jgi:hypothetical protein
MDKNYLQELLTGEMQGEIQQYYLVMEDLEVDEDTEIHMLDVEILMGKMIHGK